MYLYVWMFISENLHGRDNLKDLLKKHRTAVVQSVVVLVLSEKHPNILHSFSQLESHISPLLPLTLFPWPFLWPYLSVDWFLPHPLRQITLPGTGNYSSKRTEVSLCRRVLEGGLQVRRRIQTSSSNYCTGGTSYCKSYVGQTGAAVKPISLFDWFWMSLCDGRPNTRRDN